MLINRIRELLYTRTYTHTQSLAAGPRCRLGFDLIYTLMQDPDLYCYSLSYYIDYDPEAVWLLVQRHQGSIQPQVGGHYDFYIPRDYASILVLAFPLLRRQPQKDLYT